MPPLLRDAIMKKVDEEENNIYSMSWLILFLGCFIMLGSLINMIVKEFKETNYEEEYEELLR